MCSSSCCLLSILVFENVSKFKTRLVRRENQLEVGEYLDHSEISCECSKLEVAMGWWSRDYECDWRAVALSRFSLGAIAAYNVLDFLAWADFWLDDEGINPPPAGPRGGFNPYMISDGFTKERSE